MKRVPRNRICYGETLKRTEPASSRYQTLQFPNHQTFGSPTTRPSIRLGEASGLGRLGLHTFRSTQGLATCGRRPSRALGACNLDLQRSGHSWYPWNPWPLPRDQPGMWIQSEGWSRKRRKQGADVLHAMHRTEVTPSRAQWCCGLGLDRARK